MSTEECLFALVRSQLSGTEIPDEVRENAKENMKSLYLIAARQGFGPMIGQALATAGLLGEDDISKAIQSGIMKSYSLRVRQDFEYARICECLRKAKICYVPLKGSVIRAFYPQEWMRTSSDIDILVKEEDLDAAVEVLKKELDYTQPHDREYHDVSLFSQSGVCLELHFSLRENNEKLDKVLDTVWEHIKETDAPYECAMTPEFLVYHIVAHCAYHFTSSGCGGKAVLDLWLLRHKMGYDEAAVQKLCAQSGLSRFYEQVMHLGQVWFSQEETTPLLEEMGAYILDAGFGGSGENAAVAGVVKKGGKLKFILSRLFVPYDMLKQYYPILNRHKWLMPFYQIRRWLGGFQRRGVKSVMNSYQSGMEVTDEKVKATQRLFRSLDLI